MSCSPVSTHRFSVSLSQNQKCMSLRNLELWNRTVMISEGPLGTVYVSQMICSSGKDRSLSTPAMLIADRKWFGYTKPDFNRS